ncbi:39640_t:CDS:10 [Gigaspora margarita]|uniref:39640_t:CDS:1 n=1 Tax=Gigaspora margarita TaxID=4874 RepID=A0ABN7UPL2_GIGMA|nr:39640_t:CDS:10 [Gigaspora margarita]
MANNEIKLLENIELQFCYVENEVQFEEKLKNFLSPVLKTFASSHEIVRKKVMDNFMDSNYVKNFTIVYLKKAYCRLTEKNKITHLISLIKNIELKPVILKKRLFQIILELSQELNPKLVVDDLYSLYESSQKESLCQSQSLKSKIMEYLCKFKLAANTFPAMLHVSFDCLYSPETDINLQKQGEKFIHWITIMADTSRLEQIGKLLFFCLLKIIKKTRIENFDDLIKEQEINKFNQLNQLDEWINEENIQEIENILEENVNKVRIFEENFLIISNLTNAF